MRHMVISLSLFAVLYGCNAAYADDPPTETIEELLERRIEWITEHFSELSYDGQPLPAVESAPAENLNNMAGVAAGRDIGAIYEYSTNIIWLRDDFDAFALETQYIITHELVHYLQHLREPLPDHSCIAEREPEAYKVQQQFQREFGPWPLNWNMFFVFIISHCEHNYP